METRRWTNPSQPQTLYMAHLFLYFSAFFNLFYAIFLGRGFQLLLPNLAQPSVVEIVLEIVGGYFIANERKLGYYLAFGAAALALYPPVSFLLQTGIGTLFNLNWILAVVFPAILLILLIHPMSREYQRIWFK
jgi:hypothetical protein